VTRKYSSATVRSEMRAYGAVPEQRGDCFEAHPAVDGLGGQGVAELVGVDVADTGAFGDRRDVAGDGAPVEGLTVVAFNETTRTWCSSLGAVVGDELDEDRVQGDVAVVVEFADRDPQPVGVADVDHGVIGEGAEFTGSHPGASQQLDHQPAPRVGVVGEGGHELRRGRVVEELGEWFVGFREVAGEDRHPARCVVVVPVDDPFEERAQQTEAVADRGRSQCRGLLAGSGGEPHLVVLDVAAFDPSDRHTGRVRCGDSAGEEPQSR